jgi:LysM domain
MTSGSTVATLDLSPRFRPPGRPELRLVGPPPPTFWRRRVAVLLAALLLVAGLGLVLRAAGGSITHEPPAAPANPSRPTADYVVQPGDTVWSVARRVQPEGDVRSFVDRLVAARGGDGLAVGEVIRIEDS